MQRPEEQAQRQMVLVISEQEKDVQFWKELAESNRLGFRSETDRSRIHDFLKQNPGALVVWDAAKQSMDVEKTQELLKEHAKQSNVFVVADEQFCRNTHLSRPPVFAHHLLRRYEGGASGLYSRLIRKVLLPQETEFKAFFPADASFQGIQMTAAEQKHEIVEKVEKFFLDQNVNSRVASICLLALDEMIMNAIFDAPVDENGARYRDALSRSSKFALSEKEQVEITVACSPDLLGVSVVDKFGSLTKDSVIEHLSKDFTNSGSYQVDLTKEGAGLGLYSIIQQTSALLFVTRPGSRTEVMVFLENKKSYRELRAAGVNFFSIISENGGSDDESGSEEF